jgi:NodT family efflux transporter outer membrane factor (OMF) lipoprotein
VITAAIRQAQLSEQIKETQDILAAQEKQLSIMQNQLKLGAINTSSVLAQASLVSQTKATLPALQKSLELASHQIAILCGDFPSQMKWTGLAIGDLTLPNELPVSLPSDLVRQRPDILASEALLNQSIAALGVAKANLYPQVNLSANAGSLATLSNNLFSTPWSFWTLSTGLTAPIFNAGALNSKVQAARAGYESSFYNYKATVLGAFQNVADSLAAIEFETKSYQQQSTNAQLAKDSLSIAQKQYALGAINYMLLLDAQRNYAQAKIGLINTQANRLANTVALYQSMGGAPWVPSDTPAPKTMGNLARVQ